MAWNGSVWLPFLWDAETAPSLHIGTQRPRCRRSDRRADLQSRAMTRIRSIGRARSSRSRTARKASLTRAGQIERHRDTELLAFFPGDQGEASGVARRKQFSTAMGTGSEAASSRERFRPQRSLTRPRGLPSHCRCGRAPRCWEKTEQLACNSLRHVTCVFVEPGVIEQLRARGDPEED